MRRSIAITGYGSLSPLGADPKEIWRSYENKRSLIQRQEFQGAVCLSAPLSASSVQALENLKKDRSEYADLDKVTLMAISAARTAVTSAGWKNKGSRVGVNIGSSRGSTATFEASYDAFLKSSQTRVPPLTSPTTTLGNLSSWVAQDVNAESIALSHSMTCSSALQAVANGVAWLQAEMADRFLVGGSEAPLTPFTLAQMRALRLYSNELESEFPCQPLSSHELTGNTLVLGEGSAVFALECAEDVPPQCIAKIDGIGIASESISNATSISPGGEALYNAMQMALASMSTPDPVQIILAHAPGTIQGDSSELAAIREVFGPQYPLVLSNKWLIGHTFGASAALHLEYALLLLTHQSFQIPSYITEPIGEIPKNPINKIMINAAGFGGNAMSLIVSR